MKVVSSDRGLLGYLMHRDGARAAQIGPGAAMNGEAGRALGDAALAERAGRPVYADIPTSNAAAMAWAESRGLGVERPFTRMCRGQAVADRPGWIWASSGPECG